MKDPKHGRTVVLARDMAATLRVFFAQIGLHIAHQMEKGYRPNFQQFVQPMVHGLQPFMLKYYHIGAHQAWRRILIELARRKQLQRHGKSWMRVKRTPESVPDLLTGFDVLLPQVQQAIQNMTFQFVLETLQTAANDAETAYAELRAEMEEGIIKQESLKQVTERVQKVFTEPTRAFRIAATESSRAMHSGQIEAVKQSKIVTHVEWLSSGDACPRCLELDGKSVPLGEPFYIDPKGGQYAVCTSPPLHPHCFLRASRIDRLATAKT